MPRLSTLLLASPLLLLPFLACHEDDPGTEADQIGVGARCLNDDACQARADEADSDVQLLCLDQFKGGYCGLIDCRNHDDCPEGSACIGHDDGFNYCFLICVDKSDCNINRSADDESNCSSNITWIGDDLGKACVPPEGA